MVVVDTFLQVLCGAIILYTLSAVTLNVFQEGELKTTIIGALCISTMTITHTSVPAVDYLTSYAITTFLLICITRANVSRILAIVVFFGSWKFSSTLYQPLCFFAVFLLFRTSISTETCKKESRYISLLLLILSLLSFTQIVAQEFLPAPACVVWFQTILCLGPVLLDLMAPPAKKVTY